jgi:hypothetical protein
MDCENPKSLTVYQQTVLRLTNSSCVHPWQLFLMYNAQKYPILIKYFMKYDQTFMGSTGDVFVPLEMRISYKMQAGDVRRVLLDYQIMEIINSEYPEIEQINPEGLFRKIIGLSKVTDSFSKDNENPLVLRKFDAMGRKWFAKKWKPIQYQNQSYRNYDSRDPNLLRHTVLLSVFRSIDVLQTNAFNNIPPNQIHSFE